MGAGDKLSPPSLPRRCVAVTQLCRDRASLLVCDWRGSGTHAENLQLDSHGTQSPFLQTWRCILQANPQTRLEANTDRNNADVSISFVLSNEAGNQETKPWRFSVGFAE